MTFSEQQTDGCTQLTFSGDITLASAAELKGRLLSALDAAADVILDFSEASSVDLAVLQLLWSARNTYHRLGRKIDVIDASDRVMGASLAAAGLPGLEETQV